MVEGMTVVTEEMQDKMVEKIFSFVKNFEEKNGYPPIMREIAAKFLISVSDAYFYCSFLEIDRLIEKEYYNDCLIVRVKKDV